ncbi:MAG: Restriction endonuclease [Candidatus Wolfebacteria bacterium GW2011_GWE1_48_7]|uniref:Restriction endonuclease n=2 Tax=Candidatus Wolfeibacteriota TaxID=1752735 RepID=A0A0G1U5X8_9BACT|nr:MAG: restriction endonuclease [Candidatus Wolfebacteria bacterium GW2011_GWB1_47_1]KKU34202.1 MAG: Restriction endonuclease [Candidatus Wolfebacteria bacterium GW2011_GWC2_46_275]KKU42484.1 MAG: Restriction endonuclease [Candidatus Wolfebacteria bacterium GW2011_GWB2_46_69]KKU54269.1 MAG: Restriction endonuclease [Candidatus Wolfebacteria bacterium GW2011_GWC1_47_103]KKU59637.1 MAG: Restriction endonuclease [Candidatus Wolfebacteria bacterium GW2011_GWE2_47_12]KKU66281.1 MAG: Restriction en
MEIPTARRGEYLQTVFRIIEKNGGSLPLREILVEMPKSLIFNEYEAGHYEKTGYVRWRSMMYLYSIDCVKAGWLVKNKGTWSITEEGRKTLQFSPEEFIRIATQKYREWKRQKDFVELVAEDERGADIAEREATIGYEQAAEIARNEIVEHIRALNPYEFQDLAAALLRGMGYYVSEVAAPGPDGGVDIRAYKDPLGVEGARIKVQVKHRKDTKVTNSEVSALNGLLRNGDVGLIVSSGGFTREAVKEMRNSNNHIEKIDLDDLIDFWEEYYDKLREEDKLLLPLRRIAFLAPNK